MSYFKDLDEYTQDELENELAHRKTDKEAGKCDYCHRNLGVKPFCKFPERHKALVDDKKN